MSPILFESLLFLKLNRCLLDLKMVSKTMQMNPKDRYATLDDEDFYEDSVSNV